MSYCLLVPILMVASASLAAGADHIPNANPPGDVLSRNETLSPLNMHFMNSSWIFSGVGYYMHVPDESGDPRISQNYSPFIHQCFFAVPCLVQNTNPDMGGKFMDWSFYFYAPQVPGWVGTDGAALGGWDPVQYAIYQTRCAADSLSAPLPGNDGDFAGGLRLYMQDHGCDLSGFDPRQTPQGQTPLQAVPAGCGPTGCGGH